jgi:hypothetical protein
MSAQAADIAVRARLGLDRLGDVIVLGVERRGALARVRLRVPTGEATVAVERRELPPMRLTCSAGAEERAAHWFVRGIDLPG